MSTKKVRILSVAMTGGLIFTGATAAVITSSHAPAHTALAANMASSPPVNLDNCRVLAEGYTGGCAAQLQTELNADNGTNMPVDGIFGTRDQGRLSITLPAEPSNHLQLTGSSGPRPRPLSRTLDRAQSPILSLTPHASPPPRHSLTGRR